MSSPCPCAGSSYSKHLCQMMMFLTLHIWGRLKTGAAQLHMVLRRMHQMQVKPTLRIYNAILKACMVNVSPSCSRLAADMLAEMQVCIVIVTGWRV